MTRIIIDTNIFIDRESNREVPAKLGILFRLLGELSFSILIHPQSKVEINRDKDEERKRTNLSKIAAYPVLDEPPDFHQDDHFIDTIGDITTHNDFVDNCLLYSVYKNAVDFLITEDKGILRKARIFELSDRILNIDESLELFRALKPDEDVPVPPQIEYTPVSNLNIEDPFFSSLVENYEGFKKWWTKISTEGRKAWVYKEDNTIGAILLLKVENEIIDSTPMLPKKRRLKICTFKVTSTGNRIGELFLRMAIDYSLKNNIDALYLTTYKEQERLIDLVEEYGFEEVALKSNGEMVFEKSLIVTTPNHDESIIINRKYYPSFRDGFAIRKFIVPIRPEYFKKFFIIGPQQPSLPGIGDDIIPEMNTIKKAYLTHSGINKIRKGDILLFYRSKDVRKIVALGIVEKVNRKVCDADEILKLIAKRTVYSRDEIQKMSEKPTTVILFYFHLFLSKPVALSELKIAAPQSICEMRHEAYLSLKKAGGINERFTVD